MVITLRNSILSIFIVLVLIIPAMATSVSITIWGENGVNVSRAQDNITKYGANNSVNVSAWNITKTVLVKSLNASGDTVSFNISNMTAYRVYELKVNGTTKKGYQAGGNGMLNFSYSQNDSNVSYSLSPALNINGYNMTWAYVWNPYGTGVTTTSQQTYAENTVYQNTNQTPLIISSRFKMSSGYYWMVLSGDSNPPTTIIKKADSTSGSAENEIVYIILPNHYWKLTYGAGATFVNVNSTVWR